MMYVYIYIYLDISSICGSIVYIYICIFQVGFFTTFDPNCTGMMNVLVKKIPELEFD